MISNHLTIGQPERLMTSIELSITTLPTNKINYHFILSNFVFWVGEKKNSIQYRG